MNLLLRASGTARTLTLPQGMLLGAEPDASYQEATISLRPGDALLMFTDGLLLKRVVSEWATARGLADPTAFAYEQAGFYGAVQNVARIPYQLILAVSGARQIQHDFTVSKADYASVMRICRLVEGMPLGIELAAAWVRVLPCAEIAQELGRNLDFLAATMRDMPERRNLAACSLCCESRSPIASSTRFSRPIFTKRSSTIGRRSRAGGR